MASYHFSAQIIQRSKGRSAVAAAAYRSGSCLRDEHVGERHDYRQRRGVVFNDVLLPDGAAPFLKDRQQLWNHAQAMETRKDAQIAREINLALPAELDVNQRRETLLKFVLEAFVSRGMVADVAIHAPIPERGDGPRNHHAHIMLTLRRATKDGLHPVKTREWNSPDLLRKWRALWGVHANRALERAGLTARVDHRTLVAQREDAVRRRDFVAAALLNRKPQLHIGPKARKIVERGLVPRSRDRMVGPVRRRTKVRQPVRRCIRYPSIDKGSRAAFRARLNRKDSQSVFATICRWQAKSARLRLRKARLTRLEAVALVNFRSLFGDNVDYRWLEQQEIPHTLARQVEDAIRKLAHMRRRRGQLDLLIAEVDRTLAGLLLSQARGASRASLVLHSNTHALIRAGRLRARYPTGLSTFFPDNA